MDFCEITGTVYRTSGTPAEGVEVYAYRIIKAGNVIESVPRMVAKSDEDGVLHRMDGSSLGDEGFLLPRASTVYLEARAEGLYTNPGKGIALAIPDAASATLESLISVSAVPSTGLTVKSNGSALANRIGTLDFSSAFAVTESPTGEANVALADNPFPDYLTQTEGDARYALGSALTSEATARASADITLQTNITNEASARATADALLVPLSQRNNANGYAGLDGSGLLVESQIPASIARDTEVSSAVSAEATTRASADTTLQANITAEAAARASADAGLQPLDSDLTVIAALDSSTSGAIASDGAGWVKKTYAQLKTALGLVKADVGLGNVVNADTTTTANITDSSNKRFVTEAQQTVIGNTSGTNTGDQTTVTGNAGTATALQTVRNIDGQSFNGTADINVIAPGTHAATGKTTPVDADEVPLVDSAASNVLKKLTWANLKATLKTYFDTLYQNALGYTAENTANKDTDSTFAANSDTKYPSQKAVKTAVDLKGDKSGNLSQFAATTSAELAGVLSDENGSGGGFVRATSPTLTTPNIGAATGTTLALGTNPAASGALRIPNNSALVGRNVANNGDVDLIRVGTSNQITLGGLWQINGGTGALAPASTAYPIVWSFSSPDIGIVRSAAGLLEVNNGTTGTFRDLKVRQHYVDQTVTAAGTTGNQTINKAAGTVNIAAAGASVTVTNSLCTANSTVHAVIRTNDSTAVIKNVVPAAGSFTINLNAAATAEISIGFLVVN